MSFGWSAGDIVLALRVLYKVGCALKEADGASSTFQQASSFLDGLQKTLDHLRMFTSTTLTEAQFVELRAQVILVKAPVEKFIEDVKKFEPALGATSPRGKLLSGPRKVQWAFQMPGKIKKLQSSVMVPMMNLSLLLNLNILTAVSDMGSSLPRKLQEDVATALKDNMPGLLRTGLQFYTGAVKQDDSELKRSQNESAALLMSSMDQNKDTVLRSLEMQHRGTMNAVKTLHFEIKDFKSQLDNLPARFKGALKIQQTEDMLRKDMLKLDLYMYHAELQSLHQTLAKVTNSGFDAPFSEQGRTNRNMMPQPGDLGRQFRLCAWLLVIYLDNLLRKLLLILVPYFVALYKMSKLPRPGLLLFGSSFLLEDALGHIHRLPADQFQFWDVFYDYLKESFKGLPGYSWVLSNKFHMLNAYNGVTIDAQSWRAIIQPKVRIEMAMALEHTLTGSRCPSCSVRLKWVEGKRSVKCLSCNKNMTILGKKIFTITTAVDQSFRDGLKESSSAVEKRFYEEGVRSNDSMRTISSKEILLDHMSAHPLSLSDEAQEEDMKMQEIKKFKRVAWQASCLDGLTVLYEPTGHMPDINIIAIHGLNGGPWDTFAADFDPSNSQCKEVNWLYDILPRRLVLAGVHARIMTFGYDAQRRLKDKNKRRPSEDLKESLNRIRAEGILRPTILISHGTGAGTALELSFRLNMYETVVRGWVLFDAIEANLAHWNREDDAAYIPRDWLVAILGGQYLAPQGLFSSKPEYQPILIVNAKNCPEDRESLRASLELWDEDEIIKFVESDSTQEDLAKITTQNESFFMENVINPLVDMARLIKGGMQTEVEYKSETDDEEILREPETPAPNHRPRFDTYVKTHCDTYRPDPFGGEPRRSLFLWTCGDCGDSGMSTFIDFCPSCGHIRCGH